MSRWLIGALLAAALVLLSGPALGQKVSTLIRNAKAAEQAGKCEQAIRLYRQAKRLVVEARIKGKIQARIALCSNKLYRAAVTRADTAYASRAYKRALRWYRQARRHAPRRDRARLDERIRSCEQRTRQSGYAAALQAGDCDALKQARTTLPPTHPAMSPSGWRSALLDARRNAQAQKRFDLAGRCSEQLGDRRAALRYYRSHLGLSTPGTKGFVRIQARVAELQMIVNRQPVEVRFHSTPLGAQVRLDGKLLPQRTPFNLKLAPRQYTMEIIKPGYLVHRRNLLVSPGLRSLSTTVLLTQSGPTTPDDADITTDHTDDADNAANHADDPIDAANDTAGHAEKTPLGFTLAISAGMGMLFDPDEDPTTGTKEKKILRTPFHLEVTPSYTLKFVQFDVALVLDLDSTIAFKVRPGFRFLLYKRWIYLRAAYHLRVAPGTFDHGPLVGVGSKFFKVSIVRFFGEADVYITQQARSFKDPALDFRLGIELEF